MTEPLARCATLKYAAFKAACVSDRTLGTWTFIEHKYKDTGRLHIQPALFIFECKRLMNFIWLECLSYRTNTYLADEQMSLATPMSSTAGSYQEKTAPPERQYALALPSDRLHETVNCPTPRS